MTEINLYKSPARALKLIFLSVIFLALGVAGLKSTMPPLVAWAAILMAVPGVGVGLFHLFDRRPQIVINEVGIFDRTTYENFINWEVIQDAYILEIYKQPFICLVVDEKYKPSYKKGKVSRVNARLNESIGAQELNISLGQVRIEPDRLGEFILRMRDAGKIEYVQLLNAAAAQWK